MQLLAIAPRHTLRGEVSTNKLSLLHMGSSISALLSSKSNTTASHPTVQPPRLRKITSPYVDTQVCRRAAMEIFQTTGRGRARAIEFNTTLTRQDMAIFYCRMCSESFTDFIEMQAHRSSQDHLHHQHLKDMRADARRLAATGPDEPLLFLTYGDRDEWPWPARLLFVPEMRSYERQDGNRYGPAFQPRLTTV